MWPLAGNTSEVVSNAEAQASPTPTESATLEAGAQQSVLTALSDSDAHSRLRTAALGTTRSDRGFQRVDATERQFVFPQRSCVEGHSPG